MEEIGSTGVAQAAPDAPRGIFKVSVDDKGRLKLPAAVVEYFRALAVNKVFITTLDRREVRIYPLSAWKETERILAEAGEDIAERKAVALIAANYGKDDELDGQGRLTLPGDLRKELELEKDETRLRHAQGHFKLVSSREHERQMQLAVTDLDDKMRIIEKRGI